MGYYCGKDMAVNGESSVDMFEIFTERDLVPYSAGNSQSGVDRNDGNDDWGGRYRVYGHTPARFPGDSFTFSCAPKQTGSVGVSGTAICSKLEVIWDVANARYINSIVSFEANGALTTGAASPTDTSIPAALTAKGMTVNWDAGDIAAVDYMKLIFSMETIAYADSDSDGQIKRLACDLDVTAAWRVNTDTSADFPTAGEEAIAKFNCTSDPYFWEVKWMRIRGVRPWAVDRRGQKKPVQMLVIAEGALFDGATAGYIKTPAAVPVQKWPFA